MIYILNQNFATLQLWNFFQTLLTYCCHNHDLILTYNQKNIL